MAKRMMREIVKIDEDKCDGCGQCVPNCAEGAIQIIDGKARLVAENLCDGLGACLGTCPQDAITIERRPVEEFDTKAAERHLAELQNPAKADAQPAHEAGCPGAMLRKLKPTQRPQAAAGNSQTQNSQLGHWPVQLALVPPNSEMWQDADVLIAADCVAFAMPDFHQRLLAGKTLAVACPKLDDVPSHVEKLATIFANNKIHSLTVAHMEVPCCSGIVRAVEMALAKSGRADIPVCEVTVGIDGTILQQRSRKTN